MIYVNISWAQAKSIKTANASLQLYYTQIGFGPNEYTVILGNNSQCFVDVVAAADVTDFETNYKAAAISVVTPNDALSILDTGVPPTPVKTNVLKTGTLTTTTTTADQVILTYTVTTGKTFYMTYISIIARGTIFANNTFLGSSSLESPAGTKLLTIDLTVPNPSDFLLTTSTPIAIPSGTVVRMVCTPAAVTSTVWRANFGGYES